MRLVMNEWINKNGGAIVMSKKLDVTAHAIRHWMRGDGSPHAETIATMIRLSKGELTFEQIYKESTRSKK